MLIFLSACNLFLLPLPLFFSSSPSIPFNTFNQSLSLQQKPFSFFFLNRAWLSDPLILSFFLSSFLVSSLKLSFSHTFSEKSVFLCCHGSGRAITFLHKNHPSSLIPALLLIHPSRQFSSLCF